VDSEPRGSGSRPGSSGRSLYRRPPRGGSGQGDPSTESLFESLLQSPDAQKRPLVRIPSGIPLGRGGIASALARPARPGPPRAHGLRSAGPLRAPAPPSPRAATSRLRTVCRGLAWDPAEVLRTPDGFVGVVLPSTIETFYLRKLQVQFPSVKIPHRARLTELVLDRDLSARSHGFEQCTALRGLRRLGSVRWSHPWQRMSRSGRLASCRHPLLALTSPSRGPRLRRPAGGDRGAPPQGAPGRRFSRSASATLSGSAGHPAKFA
jgi:hypothetical protein